MNARTCKFAEHFHPHHSKFVPPSALYRRSQYELSENCNEDERRGHASLNASWNLQLSQGTDGFNTTDDSQHPRCCTERDGRKGMPNSVVGGGFVHAAHHPHACCCGFVCRRSAFASLSVGLERDGTNL